MAALAAAQRALTPADYARAFDLERAVEYPAIDAFEKRTGYAVGQAALEDAARILACPVKANPPNWQHGRVLYAAVAAYLERHPYKVGDRPLLVDVGTAKGFSAVIMAWAVADSGRLGVVKSVDIVSPDARVPRNSPRDFERPVPNVYELVDPFLKKERLRVGFVGGGSAMLWRSLAARVHFAFVDGKHSREAVAADATAIAARQKPGDMVVFDDLQIPAVAEVVAELAGYDVEILEAAPAQRRYAIATRR